MSGLVPEIDPTTDPFFQLVLGIDPATDPIFSLFWG